MNDILLTSVEMLAFNARLAALTDNRLTVGPRAITRGAARALWSTMKVFNPHTVLATRLPKRRAHVVHRGGAAFTVAAAAVLTGCTTLGGNVKGSFACRAPDGMCAPTSKIDDQALSMISGGDADATPATVINPYERADPRFVPTASANPSRSSERVLRIVFPAHVDRLGRYREASAKLRCFEPRSSLALLERQQRPLTARSPVSRRRSFRQSRRFRARFPTFRRRTARPGSHPQLQRLLLLLSLITSAEPGQRPPRRGNRSATRWDRSLPRRPRSARRQPRQSRARASGRSMARRSCPFPGLKSNGHALDLRRSGRLGREA